VGVSAQTYSANVVGYVNITCVPGFTMIANQLNNTNNSVSAVFPQSMPAGLALWTWNGAGYDVNGYNGEGDWDDGSYVFGPGQGAFLRNPFGTNVVVTFVGEVLQGWTAVTNSSGFNFIASTVPTAGNLETTMSLTNNNGIVYGDSLWTWNGSGYDVNGYNDANDWDGDPSVVVGQSFLLKHTGSPTVWNRYFTVQ
jgi:hypothetical protein